MPSSASLTVVQFGIFELDLQRAELRKSGVKVKLQAQPLKILQALVENPGQIVSREQLRSRIWPANTFVEFDQGLYSAMARLRDALGDSSDSPRFIETVARRGYRFIAPVTAVVPIPTDPSKEKIWTDTGKALTLRRFAVNLLAGLAGGALLLALVLGFNVAGAREWLRSRTTPIRSIAVLPLQNLSNDPDQEYFADGMTDELITNLAMLKNVRVISRTSSMRYKGTKKALPQIGRELHVDAVVEGSVVRSGDRVRITAQLIDASTDRHLWAASYERDLKDILLVQAEAARSITDSIRARLTTRLQNKLAKARVVDPEAYDLYLQARSYSQRIAHYDIKRCIDTFQQAIQKDPLFADAYAGLADCYDLAYAAGVLTESDSIARERNAVARALELDDSLAEAHALQCALDFSDWNWKGADRECQRSLELAPNLPAAHVSYSDLLLSMGNTERAIREVRIAAALDPLSSRLAAAVGWTLVYAGQSDESIRQFQTVLTLDPDYEVAHAGLGRAYQLKGDYELSIDEMRWSFTRIGFPANEAKALESELRDAYRKLGSRGYWQKRLEWELEDVWDKHLVQRRHVPAYWVALDYANLGEKDRAFSWLQQAYQQHEPEFVTLKVDPRLDPLRSDPRFTELLRQVGLLQ